jgi:hypothetical protein
LELSPVRIRELPERRLVSPTCACERGFHSL